VQSGTAPLTGQVTQYQCSSFAQTGFTIPPIQNPSAPLFNSPLQFDIEAYNNAAQNTITVTRTSATDDRVSGDSFCTTS
jgi:hypothetical protein